MTTPPPEEPKLIIDSDWKAQAQAEKDRLAAANKPKAPTPTSPSAAPMAANAGTPTDTPDQGDEKLGFADLVSMLATQALTYMGAFPDPRTGKAVIGLEYAKLYIDLLGILQVKTKGNLTDQEQQLMDRSVSELRGEFVELVKAVDKAVAEGKLQPQQAPGATPGGGVVMPGGFGGGNAGIGSGGNFGGMGGGMGGSLGGPGVFGS